MGQVRFLGILRLSLGPQDTRIEHQASEVDLRAPDGVSKNQGLAGFAWLEGK